jgi:hypothetical protein
MTITYTPIASESGQARSSTQDETWRRTYVLHWRAETDDKWIGAKAVRAACPVAIGNVYQAPGPGGTIMETDLGSFAVRITATEDTSAGDGLHWNVSVEYGQFNALDQTPQDPLVARPKISFTSTRFQIPAETDINDEPVVNSAGDPFDPPIMLDQTRPFMTIVRNEPYFSPLLAKDYHNALNDATWFGRPELEWKCLDITGEEAQDPDGNRYWVVTYQFELNADTWVVEPLDIGMREINSSGKKIAITDDQGREIDAPWPLNDDGSKKPSGTKAGLLEFHLYPEMDFSVLNLDAFHADLIAAGLLI